MNTDVYIFVFVFEFVYLFVFWVDRLQRSGRLVENTDVYAKIATIVTVNS